VLEGQPTLGGGARSAQLTLPGFTHDICSAVHPLAISSPAFDSMPLDQHGLEWIQPPVPVAHPLDSDTAVTLERMNEKATGFRRQLQYLAARWNELLEDILAPPHLPKHPLLLGRFGLFAPWSARRVAHLFFDGEPARALFAGIAAHSVLPLD